MSERIAVIGDADLVYAFRAVGIRVFTPASLEEADAALRGLAGEGVILCLVHERYYERLREAREAIEKEGGPAVAAFSDYRQVTDVLQRRLAELAVRATGSDSLIKKR